MLGARVPPPRLRRARAALADRDRDLGARTRDADRAHAPRPERVRTIHLAVDLERFTPSDVRREYPYVLYPVEPLAAQEPRAPVRGAGAAARPAARPHGGHSRRRRADAGPRLAGRARRSLPPRRRRRLPEPLRGLRPAAARGDAPARRPSPFSDIAAAPRGVRRRGAPNFDRSEPEDIARCSGGDRARRRVGPPSARRAGSRGTSARESTKRSTASSPPERSRRRSSFSASTSALHELLERHRRLPPEARTRRVARRRRDSRSRRRLAARRATRRCARTRPSRARRAPNAISTSSRTECVTPVATTYSSPSSLDYEPHRAHVVARVAPVAPRLQVAEPELALEPERDRRPRATLLGTNSCGRRGDSWLYRIPCDAWRP